MALSPEERKLILSEAASRMRVLLTEEGLDTDVVFEINKKKMREDIASIRSVKNAISSGNSGEGKEEL